jgi:hypothetical protein
MRHSEAIETIDLRFAIPDLSGSLIPSAAEFAVK